MLTHLMVGDVKLLCSAASESELQEMYDTVREQAHLAPTDPMEADQSRTLLFQYQYVGPIEVFYRERKFILFGSPREMRFYTPEEYAVLSEE